MINQEAIDRFRLELPIFEKNIRAFEAGDIDRNTLKGITGGFGSYAQKEGGYMLRLRLPGGHVSKDTLKFIVDKINEHQIDLLKLTTCQTIQLHNLSADSVIALIRDALEFGIFTKGGGGDNPRNVMVSPLSGTEPGEPFDVYPYAKAAGEYLIDRMPSLHMPRKLKVGFSNTPENEVHATFRDLGFVAKEDGSFSVYCAGGLGPNPKLGVWIADGVCPEDVSLYVSAMIRLFTKYGNYDSRAKARTRYLQDTLGEEALRNSFLAFLEDARKEEAPWAIEPAAPITKSGCGILSEDLVSNRRVKAQKQEGLYTVSYHPLGGRLTAEKPSRIFHTIQDMDAVELRLSPDGTIYIINLTADEVPAVLNATEDGAQNLFETSVCCIASPICQHGLRNSYQLFSSCVERLRREDFADGVLPQMHISGCPSSCGTHQAGAIGFAGHSKKVNGKMESAFKLFVNGCANNSELRLGTDTAIILETVIPEFLAALGKEITDCNSTFSEWYPTHQKEFLALAKEYFEKGE